MLGFYTLAVWRIAFWIEYRGSRDRGLGLGKAM